MTDYTEAAMNEATVRLADGSECTIYFVPAGTDGWNIPVIYSYDTSDGIMCWEADGTSVTADADIVEIVG